MEIDMKIGVVLVTFNRLDKLKKALQCYEDQSFKPLFVLVVDNNSSDGTREYLNEWISNTHSFQPIVKRLEVNSGGAGGFFVGTKCALDLDCDWVYISDDDAYPDKNALALLNNYYKNLPLSHQKSIIGLCSAVYHDGIIDVSHRNYIKKSCLRVQWLPITLDNYKLDSFELDILSYVGSLIKVSALKSVGLCDQELFIYHDDQEHSIRLREEGKIVCVPFSIINHDSFPKKYQTLSWGNYYDKRNRLILIKRHFPKRYFFVRYCLGYLRDCLFVKNKVEKQLNKAAYKDAKKNKTGVHSIYKPGWKAEG